jgi:hypothetical protein
VTPICEIEYYHFGNMSDTPSKLREVIDRSNEAILNFNNLPSTSSVFSYVAIGFMDDETPIRKMYMVYEVDAIPMDDEESSTWNLPLPQHLHHTSGTTRVTI